MKDIGNCSFIVHNALRAIADTLQEKDIGFSYNVRRQEITDISNITAALLAVYHAHDEELERLYKEKWGNDMANKKADFHLEDDPVCYDWRTHERVEKKSKVYISGPITGRDMTECKVDFNSAELWLTGLGYDVVNPLSYDVIENRSWEDYMKRDLKLLLDCDYIYLLDGWESSRGARLEYNVAFDLGIIPLTLDENGKVI
jgi:hypothetical protein